MWYYHITSVLTCCLYLLCTRNLPDITTKRYNVNLLVYLYKNVKKTNKM